MLSPATIPPAPVRRPDDPTVRRTGAAALAAGLAAAADHWLDFVEYRPGSRWTHLVAPSVAADALDPSLRSELASAQVWLLSWLPSQGTPLHDHGWSAGAFAVVRGALTERVVAAARHGRPVRQNAAELTAGRVRHFGPHYVHQVTNEGADPAVSVHVYTPALLRMNTYTVVAGLLLHTGSERAGVDW